MRKDALTKKAKKFINACKDYDYWLDPSIKPSLTSSLRDVGEIPHNAYMLLLALDNELVGTPEYMGLAYFWHYDYRHYLRDATPSKRRKIHRLALENGVDPCTEDNPEVWRIIKSVLKEPPWS